MKTYLSRRYDMKIDLPPTTKDGYAHEALMRLDHCRSSIMKLNDELPQGASDTELINHSVMLVKELSSTLIDVHQTLLSLLATK